MAAFTGRPRRESGSSALGLVNSVVAKWTTGGVGYTVTRENVQRSKLATMAGVGERWTIEAETKSTSGC
ncbi:MAG: hypothetical protein ACRDYA_04265 [Egibacteraceae bacterium]